MHGLAARLLPYALAFTSSFCIMILELVSSRLVARHVGASLTVWTSVIGIILGLVLGGLLAARVDFIVFTLPWRQVIVFAVAAIVVGLLAAIFPARRAAKLNVLEALQYE